MALAAALGHMLLACVPVTPKPAEPIGQTPPPPSLPTGPIAFEFESVDDSSVSAPAFRGKPAVLAFVVTDTLAGQAEASILAGLAQKMPTVARFVVVAVEPEDRHELVQGFVRFFTDKTHAPLLGAIADKDSLIGQGPFGDVRGLTVVILDAGGRVAFRKSGVVQASEIAEALRTM
jgi:hypothetical protein